MPTDKARLGEIAWFYYKKEWPQYRIAQEFGISRGMVSRMLYQARKAKIVNVEVKAPFELDEKLEMDIVSHYNIKKAYIVNESNEDVLDSIGRVAAFIASVTINEGDVIGLSVGRMVARMIQFLTPRHTQSVKAVQLIGGFGKVVEYDPFSLVHEICRKLSAEASYFISPAVVKDKKVKKSMLSPDRLKLWGKCNKAIFGIGPIKESILLSSGSVTQEEMDALRKLGGVGDILGHYFSREGKFIKTDLSDRIVSIPLEMLQRIPERVGLAGGEEKVEAIQGALRSGLMTTLVSDRKAASKIVELKR